MRSETCGRRKEWALAATHGESVDQDWCVTLNPAPNRDVVDGEATLSHDLLQIPIAE